MLREHFMIDYDETQSIGRRYRRQDEIGTPYCITIDYETLEDHAVTIRDRDTMEQVRVPISRLVEELGQRLAAA
jgi:glycyl-tRNA synthetase